MVSHPHAEIRGLSEGEAILRARRIALLLTDCDGVLTDGTIYCSSDGEELLRFSRRDGMGFELLRAAGIPAAIVTRERSAIVARRAYKLGVPVHSGVQDKAALFARLLEQQRLTAAEVAYIGDDVNDLPVLRAVAGSGLTGAPGDAEPVVREVAHFVSTRPGGQGAFREFIEAILDLRQRRGLRLLDERRTTP